MSNQNEDWDVAETDSTDIEEKDITTYEISYFPADFTLKGYLDKYDTKDPEIYLPPFQRRYVWTQKQASKLIESFLLGLPVPGVFLYKERETKKLLIIDGQQRILSAIKYMQGLFEEKAFRLLNVHPKWEGRKYDELSDSDQRQIRDSVLRATIVQQLSPQDGTSIFHIFERLNTGGVKLNSMEVRRCVYYGSMLEILDKINELSEWRKIIGKEQIDKTYRDVELVLRILALASDWKDYEKPMKDFLNKYLDKHKNINTEDGILLRDNFQKVCKDILEELGEKPFHLKGRLNYAVMDSVMSTILNSGKPARMKEQYGQLLQNERYIEACSISTSDEKILTERFKKSLEYFYPEV